MEKILVFKNSGIRDYWFNYILKELRGKYSLFKVYFFRREIWLFGNRIMFITLRENTVSFKAGRHDAHYYHLIENELEDNFEETLKEIIS